MQVCLNPLLGEAILYKHNFKAFFEHFETVIDPLLLKIV